jgi:hypothetical protein
MQTPSKKVYIYNCNSCNRRIFQLRIRRDFQQASGKALYIFQYRVGVSGYSSCTCSLPITFHSLRLQDSQLLNGPVPFPASPPFTDTGRFLQSDSNLWCRRSRYRYVRRHQRQSHRQNAELLEHTHCWRSHLQRHVYVDGKSSTKYCSSVELAIQDGNGRLLPPSPRKSSEDDSLCPLSVYRRGQSYSDTEEDAGIHAHSVLMLTMFCGLTAIDLLAGSCTQGRRRLDSTIL